MNAVGTVEGVVHDLLNLGGGSSENTTTIVQVTESSNSSSSNNSSSGDSSSGNGSSSNSSTTSNDSVASGVDGVSDGAASNVTEAGSNGSANGQTGSAQSNGSVGNIDVASSKVSAKSALQANVAEDSIADAVTVFRAFVDALHDEVLTSQEVETSPLSGEPGRLDSFKNAFVLLSGEPTAARGAMFKNLFGGETSPLTSISFAESAKAGSFEKSTQSLGDRIAALESAISRYSANTGYTASKAVAGAT